MKQKVLWISFLIFFMLSLFSGILLLSTSTTVTAQIISPTLEYPAGYCPVITHYSWWVRIIYVPCDQVAPSGCFVYDPLVGNFVNAPCP